MCVFLEVIRVNATYVFRDNGIGIGVYVFFFSISGRINAVFLY